MKVYVVKSQPINPDTHTYKFQSTRASSHQHAIEKVSAAQDARNATHVPVSSRTATADEKTAHSQSGKEISKTPGGLRADQPRDEHGRWVTAH